MAKIKQWLINQNRKFENYIEDLVTSKLFFHSLFIQIQTAKRIKQEQDLTLKHL